MASVVFNRCNECLCRDISNELDFLTIFLKREKVRVFIIFYDIFLSNNIDAQAFFHFSRRYEGCCISRTWNARCSAQVPCTILYFTDKTIPWRAISRDNYHTTALWFAGRRGGEGEWVPVNIYCEGNLISEESIFRAMSPGIMIHRERICPCVLFYEARAFATREGKKERRKKIRGILPFSGSLILTTMTPAVRELTWTRKFPFATYGKYFPKTRKASPNPRRVWYHRKRQKFCLPSRFTPSIEQYNSRCNILSGSLCHKYLWLIIIYCLQV